MGVKGLWKLLEGSGQPVTLESMEGKILAVDVSIWLSMAVKGMRDLHGHTANDAHLITLFHRICKLLYFGIKPVFVFDGKAPLLKQKTLSERRQRIHTHIKRTKNASEKLIQNYLKRKVVELAVGAKDGLSVENSKVKSSKKPKKSTDSSSIIELRKSQDHGDDLFRLPEHTSQPYLINSSDEEQEEQWKKRSATRDAVYGSAMSGDFKQMMAIDINSDDFIALPSDIQHELLHDIKEIRKRRRTQIEAMPEESNSFSSYQLSGLLAKRVLDERIEKVEKRMQNDNALSISSFGYDDEMYEISSIKASSLLSDENARFVLINGLKKLPNRENQDSGASSSASSATPSVIKEDDNLVSDELDSKANLKSLEILNNETTTHVLKPENNSKSEVNEKTSSTLNEIREVMMAGDDITENSVSSSCNIEVAKKNWSKISLSYGEQTLTSVTADENVISANVNELNMNNETVNFKTVACDVIMTEYEENESLTSLKQVEDEPVHVNKVEISPVAASNQKFLIDQHGSNANNQSIRTHTASDEDENDFIEVTENDKQVVSETSEMLNSSTTTAENGSSEFVEPEGNLWKGFNEEDFELLSEQLDAEDVALMEKIKSSSRAARDVSDVATTESQHLLQLFGVPYLVSPQEAESQCAFLDICGLTMGTITEDSDIWLFGGRVVFKDVFDRKREPCVYSLNDIKAELGLERNHFINIALCSGGDYTAGIEGVGPVTALEIMKEFPGSGIEGLESFRHWWDEAHRQVKSNVTETKIKSQLRKLNLPPDFPSQLVADAYLRPMVNESKEKFSWGIPDLDGIRNFAIERLNWTKAKVDEILLPVLKRAGERNAKKQTNILDFYPKSVPLMRKSKKKSKRVVRAITGISQAARETSDKLSKLKPTRSSKKISKGVLVKRCTGSETAPKLSESSSSGSE